MRSVRRGLCISVGSDLICSPVLGTAAPSVCLCWGRGVDFQGLLALLGDFPDSHANLGQAVCSLSVGTSCAHQEWCGGLEGTGRD